jgi:hypothetical protein
MPPPVPPPFDLPPPFKMIGIIAVFFLEAQSLLQDK